MTQRFWAKVERRGRDECWPWMGTRSRGYGYFRGRPAHLWSYANSKGPVPEGYDVDHVCHSRDEECPGGETCIHRRCVNPEHLEAVTHKINCLRGRSFSARLALQTHCIHGHLLAGENLRPPTPGNPGRKCRTCVSDAYLRRRNPLAKRANATRTHCPAGHPYEGANLYRYGRHRMCRACNANRKKRSRAKNGSDQCLPLG